MLSVRHVTKWFGARRVLDDVSLEVERGERVVLFGDNGCGKSTLLQLVTGVIETYEGTIRAPFPIGYAPEKPDIPDHLLGHEWLDLVASLKGCAWHRELGVDALLGCEVGAMSLGQRQRISLVAALTGTPELLVLDEPTRCPRRRRAVRAGRAASHVDRPHRDARPRLRGMRGDARDHAAEPSCLNSIVLMTRSSSVRARSTSSRAAASRAARTRWRWAASSFASAHSAIAQPSAA